MKEQKERRRIQNRLHQRASRKPSTSKVAAMLYKFADKRRASVKMGLALRPGSEDCSRELTIGDAASTSEAESNAITKSPQTSSDQSSQKTVISEQVLTYDRCSARRHHTSYYDRAGRCSLISRDHQLLTVIAHNVCCAILTNTSIVAKVRSTASASHSCCEVLRNFE